MTKNRPHLLLRLRLGGLLSMGSSMRLETRCFVPFVQQCISTATVVCAHSTAILINRGPSEFVEERIFYALQVMTRTIL